MAEIDGFCDDRFAPVRQAFTANLEDGSDVGASVAVTLDGEFAVDLWGGFADAERTVPWGKDTITNVWSTTKTVTSLAALTLVERGLLDVDAPVARYWPEFAANGKDGVLVRHLMSHTSGVSGWEQPITVDDIYDWSRSTAHLAAQAPWWEPGTASGYHALNYGHLVGEVVRRIDGRMLGRFVAEELAAPLQADFHIGLPSSEFDRVSNVIPPPPLPIDLATLPPVALKTFTGPGPDATASWTTAWRQADIGAANGHGNARSVARMLSVVANRGTFAGVDVLSPATIDRIFEVQSDGVDLVLGLPVRFGIGFGLATPVTLPAVPDGRICYWGGWGGSAIVIDVDRRLCIAYMMNKMEADLMGAAKNVRIIAAAYRSLG